MIGKIGLAAGVCMVLTGCVTNRGPALNARELVPPQRGIYVGSLYYAQEKPTAQLEVPTALELLCDAQADLTVFGVANPQPMVVADINLLYDNRLQTSLSGIQTKLISVGLSGNVSDYYDYKLTNVTKYTISESAAQTVFDAMSEKRACHRSLQRQAAFGIYQVKATYVGDIVFQRKQVVGADGSVALKLEQIEPAFTKVLKQTLELGFSGQGVVFSFVPIVRNPSGS